MLSIIAPYLLATLGTCAATWIVVRYLDRYTDDWLEGKTDV